MMTVLTRNIDEVAQVPDPRFQWLAPDVELPDLKAALLRLVPQFHLPQMPEAA